MNLSPQVFIILGTYPAYLPAVYFILSEQLSLTFLQLRVLHVTFCLLLDQKSMILEQKALEVLIAILDHEELSDTLFGDIVLVLTAHHVHNMIECLQVLQFLQVEVQKCREKLLCFLPRMPTILVFIILVKLLDQESLCLLVDMQGVSFQSVFELVENIGQQEVQDQVKAND